jgi:hypothetical protein
VHRRHDPEAYAVATRSQNAHLDAVPNHDRLAAAARENQHDELLWGRRQNVPEWIQALVRHHLMSHHAPWIDNERRAQIDGNRAVGLHHDQGQPEERFVLIGAEAMSIRLVDLATIVLQDELGIDRQERSGRPFDGVQVLKWRRRLRREEDERPRSLETGKTLGKPDDVATIDLDLAERSVDPQPIRRRACVCVAHRM